MSAYQSCLICGSEGPQVRPRMVEWAEPIGSKRFELIPACVDVVSCRKYTEAQGDVWPLTLVSRDRTTSSPRSPSRQSSSE